MKFRLIEPGSNPEQTREIVVNQTDFLIGRGTDCDLRLGEATISRHHCIIHLAGDEATLIDLGSSNGTYLNGQRVRSRSTLASGDELVVGNSRFVVNLGDQAWIKPGKASDENPDTVTKRLRDLPKR